MWCYFAGFPYPEQFLPRLVSNTAWMLALCFYFYITFLGYKCKYLIAYSYDFENSNLPYFQFFVVNQIQGLYAAFGHLSTKSEIFLL